MKAARALVSRMPGLADALMKDWQRAAAFYARFGISEVQFYRGAADLESPADREGPDVRLHMQVCTRVGFPASFEVVGSRSALNLGESP